MNEGYESFILSLCLFARDIHDTCADAILALIYFSIRKTADQFFGDLRFRHKKLKRKQSFYGLVLNVCEIYTYISRTCQFTSSSGTAFTRLYSEKRAIFTELKITRPEMDTYPPPLQFRDARQIHLCLRVFVYSYIYRRIFMHSLIFFFSSEATNARCL